jgi:hypothetical protein
VTVRRLAVLSAAAALAVVLVVAGNPGELLRRARYLAGSAPLELARRRAGGSGTAFDRDFFVFVEAVRRTLPSGVPGVAVMTNRSSPQALYLASYVLAPVPVLVEPHGVPPGWLAAVYRVRPPEGWRIVARLPNGALAARP